MKHGLDTSGSATATAGLKRSVCPVASNTPRPARGVDQSVGFIQPRRKRLLDERRNPRFDEWERDLDVRDGRRRHRHSVDPIDDLRGLGERGGAVFLRDGLRPCRFRVHDGDEVDALHRREQPGVVLPHMAHPDDRHAEPAGHSSGSFRIDRPLMAIPA